MKFWKRLIELTKEQTNLFKLTTGNDYAHQNSMVTRIWRRSAQRGGSEATLGRPRLLGWAHHEFSIVRVVGAHHDRGKKVVRRSGQRAPSYIAEHLMAPSGASAVT